jgi:hypothetical protein
MTGSDYLVEERKSLLEELKVYGRDVRDSDPIYTDEVVRPPKLMKDV